MPICKFCAQSYIKPAREECVVADDAGQWWLAEDILCPCCGVMIAINTIKQLTYDQYRKYLNAEKTT